MKINNMPEKYGFRLKKITLVLGLACGLVSGMARISYAQPALPFPPVAVEAPQPIINGPRVMGASPRKPFLYLIPATGKAPLSYVASGLPTGLQLDAKTGIITGAIQNEGTYEVRLTVSNALGKATRNLTLICGPYKLALTPPMAWNSWSVFGEDVTAEKVREQVDWLIKSGLAARGFQYIIVDDTWQARRNKDGTLSANKRFGSMRALANYVHSKGLKIGLLSSPNEHTCGGHIGSAGYEEKDAARFAEWGIDYLKYDWCPEESNRDKTTRDQMQAAFLRMRAALDKVDRDIVLAVTTYGFGGQAAEWSAAVGANSWTTETTMLDDWGSIERNGFNQSSLATYCGPGQWNDHGMLMLGRYVPRNPRFTRLDAYEQMTQLSLWCLSTSPLVISCDLALLDPNTYFPVTTSLLTNSEVIAINQDPLGRSATRMALGDTEVWTKPLADGTLAVGLFNRRTEVREGVVRWRDIGLSGKQAVRDLWLRKDLGQFDEAFKASVPPHGVVFLKIGQPKEFKIEPAWFANAGQRKVFGSGVRTIIPLATQETFEWHYTFEKPEDGWTEEKFNERRWNNGQAGFGAPEGVFKFARTDWKTPDIWLRRAYHFWGINDGVLKFRLRHQGDVEIYINGVLAATATGRSTDIIELPLSEPAQAALKDGWNRFAVHCKEPTSSGYIDVGLVQYTRS